MIISCPACDTRYRVDDSILADPAGRELRCANCGHRWRYTPDAVPNDAPAAATPPAEEPVRPVPLVAEPELSSAPLTPPRRGSRVGLGCLAVIVIIALVVAASVLARNWIVAHWPATVPFYRTVGLKPEPPGSGLEVSKMSPTRDGDALTVEGDVVNSSNGERTVPRLRIALRDAAGKELTFKVIDPPAPELAPGEAAHFKTQFEHPNDAATGVAVTFAR